MRLLPHSHFLLGLPGQRPNPSLLPLPGQRPNPLAGRCDEPASLPGQRPDYDYEDYSDDPGSALLHVACICARGLTEGAKKKWKDAKECLSLEQTWLWRRVCHHSLKRRFENADIKIEI